MCSMRAVLNELVRRMIPCTSYPFASRNSARYDPSCPVTPVISAFGIRPLLEGYGASGADDCTSCLTTTCRVGAASLAVSRTGAGATDSSYQEIVRRNPSPSDVDALNPNADAARETSSERRGWPSGSDALNV